MDIIFTKVTSIIPADYSIMITLDNTQVKCNRLLQTDVPVVGMEVMIFIVGQTLHYILLPPIPMQSNAGFISGTSSIQFMPDGSITLTSGTNVISLNATGITITNGTSSIVINASGITMTSGAGNLLIGATGVIGSGINLATHTHTTISVGNPTSPPLPSP